METPCQLDSWQLLFLGTLTVLYFIMDTSRLDRIMRWFYLLYGIILMVANIILLAQSIRVSIPTI